jgi:hypothetical protein
MEVLEKGDRRVKVLGGAGVYSYSMILKIS